MTYEIRAVKKCGDGGWRVLLSNDAGSTKMIRRRFQASNEEQAARIAATIQAEVNGRWTIGMAADVCIAHAASDVSRSTIVSYQRLSTLLSPISASYIDLLSPSDVQAYIDELSFVYGTSMVKKVSDFLKRICDNAVHCGGASSNPCIVLSPPRCAEARMPSVDSERLERMLASMSGPIPSAIGLVAFCGLQTGEVAALKLADFADEEVNVTGRVTRGSPLKRQTIEYPVAKSCRVPRWVLRSIEKYCAAPYLYGGAAPASVDAISRKMRWTLECIGCKCTLAQLRHCANAQTHKGIDA